MSINNFPSFISSHFQKIHVSAFNPETFLSQPFRNLIRISDERTKQQLFILHLPSIHACYYLKLAQALAKVHLRKHMWYKQTVIRKQVQRGICILLYTVQDCYYIFTNYNCSENTIAIFYKGKFRKWILVHHKK